MIVDVSSTPSPTTILCIYQCDNLISPGELLETSDVNLPRLQWHQHFTSQPHGSGRNSVDMAEMQPLTTLALLQTFISKCRGNRCDCLIRISTEHVMISVKNRMDSNLSAHLVCMFCHVHTLRSIHLVWFWHYLYFYQLFVPTFVSVTPLL